MRFLGSWALVATLLWSTGSLVADDLDSVFDTASADVEAAPAPAAVPKAGPVTAFGTLSAYGVAASDASVPTAYGAATATVGLDVRPDNTLRILGSVVTDLPNTTGSSSTAQFSVPRISELFVDYVVGDWAVLRGGQFALTWGQARLVTNVGNFVSEVSTGESLKAALPVGNGTLNALVSAQGTLAANKDPSTLLTAGSFDQTFGPVTLGGAVAYQKAGPLKASSSAKTSLAGADWYTEVVGVWTQVGMPHEVDVVAGFLWQGLVPTVTVAGEYLLQKVADGASNDQHTSVVGLSYDGKSVWGFTPKLQWFHAWEDGSGQVLPALVASPEALQHVTLTLGVPVVYGAAGSRYVAANDDPAQRRWAVGLKVAVDYSF